MLIFSVDLGFVQTKAVAHGWQEKFGSLTKKASSTEVNALADSEGYSVTYEGNHWRVGAKGSYDFTGERMSRDTDIVKLLTAFGVKQKNLVIDTLMTGLPIEEFNTYRAVMKENLERKRFFYYFGRELHTAEIRNVTVLPQSAGAFYDMILDEYGEIADDVLASETVLTIDVGGRTTDCNIMESGRYSQESFTVFRGVWKIHDQLRKLVQRDYKFVLKPYEVDIVARTGAVKLGGNIFPCQNLVNEAVQVTFPELKDELTLHIDDFRRFGGIVLTGGGAHLYKDVFGEMFARMKVPMTVSEEAEFSNAKGYYKYGLFKLSQGV